MTTEQEFPAAPPPSDWGVRADLLARVAKVLALEVELERLLPQVIGLATEVLGADRSSLFLYDPARDELRGTVTQGLGGREIRFPARTGLAGYALETGRPLVIADAYTDPRFDRSWDVQTGYRTRSMLVAPILGRKHALLGVIQVLNKRGGGAFTPTDAVLLDAFGSHVAVALERAMLAEAYADRQQMQAELALARNMQRQLLPSAQPDTGRLDIAAYLAPANVVGGDFYDYFSIDAHRIGFAVGDVGGRGMPAALQMASVQALLRAYGQQGEPPGRCLVRITETRRGTEATSASLLYGVLDTRTGAIEVGNAGHPPPILLRQGCAPTVLGAEDQHALVLHPGDGLMLYTKGVVNAQARDRPAFGGEGRRAALYGSEGETAEAVVHRVLAAVEAFAGLGEQRDDLTVLVLRYLG